MSNKDENLEKELTELAKKYPDVTQFIYVRGEDVQEIRFDRPKKRVASAVKSKD